MTDRLVAATRAYRHALDAVETTRAKAFAEAARRVDRARERAETARVTLAEAIIAADQHGTRQRDIVDATGYSRERIRQIIRAGAGSGGTETGRKPLARTE